VGAQGLGLHRHGSSAVRECPRSHGASPGSRPSIEAAARVDVLPPRSDSKNPANRSMRSLRSLALLVCLVCLGACATTHDAPQRAPESPGPIAVVTVDPATAAVAEERLRAFLADRRIPGLAIAVGLHDEVLWSTALGVADLTTEAPITSDSVFPLGSTSKPLTSLVLGQLVEERRIDLDAPIQDYVPYFPTKEHVLTTRLLAGHLSGVRDYDHAAGEYDNTRHFASVREAVAVFADDALLFEPGTRYAYSAYNFVLLSAAIEGAAGADFLTVLDERLVVPLGLEHTGPNRAPVSNLVTSYVTGFFGRVVPARPNDPSNKWAAGGLVSTPLEMVRLGNAVLAGRVVEPATFTLLSTPQTLSDGSDSGAGYGLGWRRGERALGDGRVVPVVHHGGTGAGSMSFFVLYPTEGLVVSLQSNLLFEPFTTFATEAFEVAESFLTAPD